jgi:hypothetical protein
MTWACPKCNKQVEQSLDRCWYCGCSGEGVRVKSLEEKPRHSLAYRLFRMSSKRGDFGEFRRKESGDLPLWGRIVASMLVALSFACSCPLGMVVMAIGQGAPIGGVVALLAAVSALAMTYPVVWMASLFVPGALRLKPALMGIMSLGGAFCGLYIVPRIADGLHWRCPSVGGVQSDVIALAVSTLLGAAAGAFIATRWLKAPGRGTADAG